LCTIHVRNADAEVHVLAAATAAAVIGREVAGARCCLVMRRKYELHGALITTTTKAAVAGKRPALVLRKLHGTFTSIDEILFNVDSSVVFLRLDNALQLFTLSTFLMCPKHMQNTR